MREFRSVPEVFETLDVLAELVFQLIDEVGELENVAAADLVEKITVLLLSLLSFVNECVLYTLKVEEDRTDAVLLFDLVDFGIKLEEIAHLLLDLAGVDYLSSNVANVKSFSDSRI